MYFPVLAAGQAFAERYQLLKPRLILLFVIFAALLISSVVFTVLGGRIKRTKKSYRKSYRFLLRLMYITTAVVLILACLCSFRYRAIGNALMDADQDRPVQTDAPDPTDSKESTGEPTVETTEATEPSFELMVPSGSASVDSINWEIITHGMIVDEYTRPESISFGEPDSYFALPGIATFRGNNYRNSAVYGTATVTEKTITKQWQSRIGALNGWSGSGWTGQPLIVQWDEETKANMNLYSSKKAKEGLVEVIYATMDGHIYFLDLEDGSYTRDPLYLGMTFKGAGSLDPRGYPILYVGSGVSNETKVPRMYIISLLDTSILFERSGNDAYSLRDWTAFDSSPLVDAETDTLIWPGENGILYTYKLNTVYDKAAGTLTMEPDETVKIRYTTDRSNSSTYWIGFEPSAVIVGRYLYISENGGMFFCINLDTMELEWAQDTRDDSNSTPVFEPNGTNGGYLYTAPSLHWTNVNGSGYICIYKLDAANGDIVWEKRMDCYTVTDLSGGVQSSPILGKPGTELEGLILYTVARTPNIGDGKLIALDTDTGELVWEKYMSCYSWSSPVAVYDENGKAYIFTFDSVGNMTMLNASGEVLDTLQMGSNVEASPAVYENTLVVGTRGGLICGIQIQ